MADLASNWIEVFENVSKQVNGLILWRRFCGFELPKPKAVKVSHQSTQDGWGWQRTTGINPLTTKIKISFLCTVFHTLLIRCQLKQNYKPMFSFLLIAFYFTLIGIIIRLVRPPSCKPVQNWRQWKLTCVGPERLTGAGQKKAVRPCNHSAYLKKFKWEKNWEWEGKSLVLRSFVTFLFFKDTRTKNILKEKIKWRNQWT